MMEGWKALLGRISLFPALSSAVPVALNVYRQIWGDIPSTFMSQENPLAPTLAQGRVGGLTINCVGQQTRLDFNLTAADSLSSAMTLSVIDHPRELVDQMAQIIASLSEHPVLERAWYVTLALQFISVKDDYAEANRVLTSVIPDVYGLRLTNEEGAVFQVGMPRMCGDSGDIRMNFVTKWSVELLQVVNVQIPAGPLSGGAGVAPPIRPVTFIAASVLFENNNIAPAPPGRDLGGREQSGLLREALDAVVRSQREIGLNIEEL